jgi:ubiquinone/menaquinone biosynthesis C-methylase UbiE
LGSIPHYYTKTLRYVVKIKKEPYMGFIEKFIKQCRKPSGRFGRFVGRMMNVGHGKVRRWGLRHISIEPDATILDIGCGGGKAVQELAMSAPNGKVYGVDYSEDMVQLSKRVNKALIKKGLVDIRHGTVSSLPFAENTFDLATAFEAYYFWPNLIDDLKEIKRVLKPNGTLLMVNEAYKDPKFEKRNAKLAKLLDMALHAPDEYKDFLDEAGYHIVSINIDPNRNWIAAVARK